MTGEAAEAPPRRLRRHQLGSAIRRLTPAERAARGKAARAAAPRVSHATFDPPPEGPEPIALLEEQAQTRVPELVPVRYGRMMTSPFTYYRGAAQAIAQFAAAYADQNEKDHQALIDAVAVGRITAEPGL